MRSINKVILIGNLTRDPEMRQTPNGQNVVTFGLATNREWITKDGRKQNSAEFHELVAWAKLADICAAHLKKGKLVYIEGYLKTRSWDATDGTKKFRTEIVVQDMIMLDKRNHNGEDEYIPEEGSPHQSEPISRHHDQDDNEEHEEVLMPAPQLQKEIPVETSESTKTPDTPEMKTEPVSEPPQPEEKKSDKIDIDSDLGL